MTTTITRNGKIARLPRSLRETLNRRLDDGEPGPRLVKWLNGEAEVKKVLEAEFGGRGINAQNLSDWRRGGYADWGRHQHGMEVMGQTIEEAKEFEAVCQQTAITDRAAEAAGLSLLIELKAAGAMKPGPKRREATVVVVRELVRLRRSDHHFRRSLREAELHAREIARQDWQTERVAMDEKLRAEDWVNAQATEVRGYFKIVRQAQETAKTGYLPAAAAEFLAAETEFEKRHTEALAKIQRYAKLREQNLPPDAEWTEPVTAVKTDAAATDAVVKTDAGDVKSAGAVKEPEVATVEAVTTESAKVGTGAEGPKAGVQAEAVKAEAAGEGVMLAAVAETGPEAAKAEDAKRDVPAQATSEAELAASDAVKEPAREAGAAPVVPVTAGVIATTVSAAPVTAGVESATVVPVETAPVPAGEAVPADASGGVAGDGAQAGANGAGVGEGAKPAGVVVEPDVPAWVPPPPDDNSYHIQKMKRRAERLKYFDSWEPRPRWGDGLL